MPDVDLNAQPQNTDFRAYEMALAAAYIAGPVVLAYFAAPYLAMATRAAFPYVYGALVGNPSPLAYYTTYIPAREKVCMEVYMNAPKITAAAMTAIQVAKQSLSTGLSFFPSTASTSASAGTLVPVDISPVAPALSVSI